jgi:hypothetical protein
MVEVLTEVDDKSVYYVERAPDGSAVETRLEPRLLK